MKKQWFMVIAVLCLLTALLVSGCKESVTTTTTASTSSTPTSTAAQPIKLLLGTFEHDNAFTVPAMKAWGADLTDKSGGRVQVEYSFGSALGGFDQYIDLMKNGICDVAFVIASFMKPGVYPMSEIAALPWTLPTGEASEKSWRAVTDAGYLDKEYSDVKVCFFANGGRGATIVSKKSIPHPADVKGLKIFAANDQLGSMVSALGGIPVSIPNPEIYSALQKGVIDAGIMIESGLYMENEWENCPYFVTPELFGSLDFTLMMNKDVYNKLPADIQKIVDGLSKDMKYPMLIATTQDENIQKGVDLLKQHGGQINEWSTADLQTMQTLWAPVWQKYIADKSAKGLPAKQALDTCYNSLKASGVQNPAVGYTP